MADVSLPRTRFDAQRGIVYAAGAGLANFGVLWLLHWLFSGNRWSLGPIPFPISLLVGIVLGALCWVGVETGHAGWLRAESAVAGSGKPSRVWAASTIAVSLALGVAAVLLPSSSVALITLLILVEAAVAALFHGYFTGARSTPDVAVGTLMAFVFCTLAGALFGLGAGIAYTLTYTPPDCSHGCAITFGPAFGALFLVIAAAVLGLALGFGMSVASACGLLARPFAEQPRVSR